MTQTCFIFGLGYVATRFATALQADGWRVVGTTRTPEKADALADSGVEIQIFGPDAPKLADESALADASAILVSTPPDGDDDLPCRQYGAAIGRSENLKWLGYLSTTGVYGDLKGGEATEATPTAPTSKRSERRVSAEAAWQAATAETHIFRLPGIYGPGRNALKQVVEGRARRIIGTGRKFSRIHVDDIVQTLRASMARPRPGAVYNVCDDLPAESADVIAYAAELLSRPPPPAVAFEQADMSDMARSFYRDDKTIANDLIKTELGVTLRYPTYREGLRVMLPDYSAG